jgi:hypothetical protein
MQKKPPATFSDDPLWWISTQTQGVLVTKLVTFWNFVFQLNVSTKWLLGLEGPPQNFNCHNRNQLTKLPAKVLLFKTAKEEEGSCILNNYFNSVKMPTCWQFSLFCYSALLPTCGCNYWCWSSVMIYFCSCAKFSGLDSAGSDDIASMIKIYSGLLLRASQRLQKRMVHG